MLNINDTTVICIDIQEKLVNMLANSNEIALNCEKIMKAANILNVDTIITEQYPKGLGSTIEPIKSITCFKTIEKTTFSALQFILYTHPKRLFLVGWDCGAGYAYNQKNALSPANYQIKISYNAITYI